MGLRTYILKRTIYSFALILFVLALNFAIFDLMPGDPTALFANQARLGGVEVARAMEGLWGLNQPLHVRFVTYMRNMLTGQFGISYISMAPIAEEVTDRLLNTFLLVGVSTIFSIIIGIVLGVIAAYKRGSISDSLLVLSSLTTYSVPSFWLGMILLLVFSYRLDWFPSVGTTSFSAINPAPNIFVYITDKLWHLFLPALTLTLFMYGGYLLLTRATMLETLTEDYIMTARAKGLKERTILFKHALKNASLPLITNAAISIGFILSGAIITEQVFNYPGLGMWTWKAIDNTDYPVLHCIFFLVAICVIAANFIADLLYGVIDPRIKYG
ncbi:MAG: ABC transporter permease [Candidatus Bathyarchaeota archaeon]|nr:ABC transporter permease [Candidatus Bathyarchaeota archaeon]